MKLFRKIDDFPTHLRGGALSIGNFDGVHRGHARLLAELIEHADTLDGPSIVFTFDPHPVRLLNPEKAPPPLTWTDRKAELLGHLGIDVVIAYPTSRELLGLEYTDFFEQIILKKLGVRAMVEGPNFYFGKDRMGTVKSLAKLCEEKKMALKIVDPVVEGDEYISSSRIRKLIASGDVGPASRMLTQPYRLRGMVTHGAGRGHELGFPTANLDAVDTLVPGQGVFAGRAIIEETKRWAAIHIGPSETFGDVFKIEVHVLDFDASIYGQTIEVEFLERLRKPKKFDSASELKKQLNNDIEQIRVFANNYSTKAI